MVSLMLFGIPLAGTCLISQDPYKGANWTFLIVWHVSWITIAVTYDSYKAIKKRKDHFVSGMNQRTKNCCQAYETTVSDEAFLKEVNRSFGRYMWPVQEAQFKAVKRYWCLRHSNDPHTPEEERIRKRRQYNEWVNGYPMS